MVSDRNDAATVLTVRDSVEGARRTIPAHAVAVHRRRQERPHGGRIRAEEDLRSGVSRAGSAGGRRRVRRRCATPISKIKYSGAAELGLAPGAIKRGIAFGISQSGRFLRTYLYYGFNEDESHRKVFDGVMPHVAGSGRGSFNHRFAQPSRDGHPYINFFYPTDIFPFTDAEQSDPETGLTDGLLTHATKPAHPAEHLLYELVVRILGPQRVAVPHHRRRHEGRAAAGERARLSALRRATRRGARSRRRDRSASS